MNFFKIIKYDYLQRTRSYAFLITLCAGLAMAYTFVPEPNANYATIRISDYIGVYNSAWFGYVTAIMSSVFLSLIGFYLVNSAIEKDIETKVGQIIASTSVSNFKYLFSKVISNFLILLTIVLIIFLMSITLFFLYNDGYSFQLLHFVKPYLFITLPAMFFIAVLAVVFEVVLGRYSILKNVLFFFLFIALLLVTPFIENQFSLDVFGNKIVIHQMEEMVKGITQTNEKISLTIGYVIGNIGESKKFIFNGVHFPYLFLISRVLWIGLGILLTVFISTVFHRFNVKENVRVPKQKSDKTDKNPKREIILSRLPKTVVNYGILPLLKVEISLLIRNGKRWLWGINILGMVLLAFLPLEIAHQIILPILWFLQVARLSELVTKEIHHNVYYFAFTSYKPIVRVLVSQLLAGIVLMLFIASPLIIRLLIQVNFIALSSVVFGGIFIVLFAAGLGIITKSKKLFEVVFFLLTYANINKIAFVDYFGGLTNQLNTTVLFLCAALLLVSLKIRMYQIKNM